MLLRVLTLVILVICCFATIGAVPVERSHDEIVNSRRSEFDQYIKKISDVLQDPKYEPVAQENMRKYENDTVSMVLSTIAHFPDLADRLHDLKRHEVRMLKYLYQYAMHPDTDKRVQDTLIKRIAEKEQYLSGQHSEQFTADDVNKITKIIGSHIDTQDRERHEIIKLHRLKERISILKKITVHNMTRDEYGAKLNLQKEDHLKTHKRIPYPMSHEQLMEVWTNVDGMDKELDIKPFFELHDLDGNGGLDMDEVDAMVWSNFKDLPEDQRENELIRSQKYTREHVDKNKDGIISFEELKATFESNNREEWKVEDLDSGHGDEIPEYEKLREELIADKPDQDDPEAMAEWEIARKDMEEIYRDMQNDANTTPSPGIPH